MTRLAFAIDGSIEMGMLAEPMALDGAIAVTMASFIGADALIYRIGETQGSYFGIARLASLAASEQMATKVAIFDRLRLFTRELPYPAGVTMLTRLQLLDEAEFEAIVQRGIPFPAPQVAVAPAQSFAGGAPTYAAIGRVVDGVKQVAGGLCALTGERVGDALRLAVIWPKGVATGLHANNLIPLSPEALGAFDAGHFTVRDDGSVVVDMARIDRALLARINASGKLRLPENTGLQPDPLNLAHHRRAAFGIG